MRMEEDGNSPAGLAIVDERGKINCATRSNQIKRMKSRPPIAFTGRAGLAASYLPQIHPPSRHHRESFGRFGRVCVVCSGAIDTQTSSKIWLSKYGASRNTRSDAEIIAYHLNYALKNGESFHGALRRVIHFVFGAFSFVALIDGESETLIATCKGMPIYLGSGRDFFHIASESSLLPDSVSHIFNIEHGDLLVLSRDRIDARNVSDQPVFRRRMDIGGSERRLSAGGSAVSSSGASGTST
jgi:glucosamine--fructose-6-phosphate aminotransferase (isomerizing)